MATKVQRRRRARGKVSFLAQIGRFNALKLIARHGHEGYGIFRALLDELEASDVGMLFPDEVATLGSFWGDEDQTVTVAKACVEFGLLVLDGDAYYAPCLRDDDERSQVASRVRTRARKRAPSVHFAPPAPQSAPEVAPLEHSAVTDIPAACAEDETVAPRASTRAKSEPVEAPLVFPPFACDEECINAWGSWIQFRKAKRTNYAAKQYEQMALDKAAGFGRDALLWAIENSMAQGYTGLFPQNYPALRVPETKSLKLDARRARESEVVRRAEEREAGKVAPLVSDDLAIASVVGRALAAPADFPSLKLTEDA